MARGREATKRYNARRKARSRVLGDHEAKMGCKAAAITEVSDAPPARAAPVHARGTNGRSRADLGACHKADLLAFQLAHFGDDTCPHVWFVDAEAAVTYDPARDDALWGEKAAQEEGKDDGLGWYEDGVKRTLTDEQIAMFRHTEWEKLFRAQRLAREEVEWRQHGSHADGAGENVRERTASVVSDHSDMDGELIGLVDDAAIKPRAKTSSSPQPAASSNIQFPVTAFNTTKLLSQSSSNARRGSSGSTRDPRYDHVHDHMKKQRGRNDIPYQERNKRKWEEHVAVEVPVKGTWMYRSKTENRLRRELDEIKDERVELDY